MSQEKNGLNGDWIWTLRKRKHKYAPRFANALCPKIKAMTLLCHFLNGEHILPWWIAHHKTIFDHAVLVDHGSTDRSVEIIQEMAPSWEIVSTQTLDFGANIVDDEMMEIEKRFDGPKIVLNVTEFLFGEDIRASIEDSQSQGYDGIVTRGAIMVDPNVGSETYPDELLPLVWSLPYGQFEDTLREHMPLVPLRSRVLHWQETGEYWPGRHSSRLQNLQHRKDVMTLWFHYSPLNPTSINGHSTYFSRYPSGYANWLKSTYNHFATDEDYDRAMLDGYHHLSPPYHFLRHFLMLRRVSMNLKSDDHFGRAFERWYGSKWFEVLSKEC